MKRSICLKCLIVLGMIMLAGCQTTKDSPNMITLGVDYSWDGIETCVQTSPPFTITNIPPGTKYLDFWMDAPNNPGYTHGGSAIEYKGSGNIPKGAIEYNTQGPCPPSGKSEYIWTVKALNADKDTVLGKGVKRKPYP